MLCYNLYYGYHIKKNLPFDFVTFSVTDMKSGYMKSEIFFVIMSNCLILNNITAFKSYVIKYLMSI